MYCRLMSWISHQDNSYTSILTLTILSTVYYAFKAILGGTASIVKMAAKDAAGAEVVVCISCTYVLYLIIFISIGANTYYTHLQIGE